MRHSVSKESNVFLLSRKFRNSSTSFLMSLCVHLGILLFLSGIWITGRYANNIVMDGQTVQRNDDFNSLSTLSIELPNFLQPLDLDTSTLESTVDRTLEFETEVELDRSQVQNSSFDHLDNGANEELGTEVVSATFARSGESGFFGIAATGNRIVYVIDRSPSMSVGVYRSRYQRACNEVLKSVDHLQSDQEFFVYLFSFQSTPMHFGSRSGEFCRPTPENKQRLAQWLQLSGLDPGTDPRESLVAALKQEPSCIFLLSDGEFNGRRFHNGPYRNRSSAVDLAKRFNKTECPIHTIGLEDAGNQREMTLIAKQSGGIYKFVPVENQ